MKKKVVVSIICIAVLLVLFTIWSKGRNVRILEDLDITTLSKIVIFLGGSDITIAEQQDMKKVVDVVQSMRLNKTFPNGRDGIPFIIDLYYKNGNKSDYGIASDYIIADDGSYYKTDRDYCDDFYKLYDELSK